MCAAPSSAPERPVLLEDHLGMTLREWIERYQSQIVTKQLRYKGVRIWKNVLDLWTYQELIFETRPTVVVEIGAKHGGSLLWFSDVMRALRGGRVVSIDLVRPEIELPDNAVFVQGSSLDAQVFSAVQSACGHEPVMVVADADHRAEHVLAELRTYSPLVGEGCYYVVEDGIVDVMDWKQFCPGPAEAVQRFVAECDEFEIDRSREKFILTYNPGGFLRRVSDA
ncbi:MAG: CmcI family methyltransferase [Planctomycetota bacterium]